MNLKIFAAIIVAGIVLVGAQGFSAYIDDRFSRKQLDDMRIVNSWSFLQHGGMWADVFIITPLVAFIVSTYRLDVTSWWGIGTLVVSAVITLGLLEFYRRMGIMMGDHCTHDGKTTIAGWIHGLYAFAAVWVILQVYLGLTTPIVSTLDIVFFSILLTPFFYIGVAKFSELWVFSAQDKIQVAALTTLVWAASAVRIYLNA